MIKQKEYLVTALFEGNRLAEINCDNMEQSAKLGNVYVGKIKRITPNINAAFVEIAPGEMTYLPLENVKDPMMVKQLRPGKLTENDELVVQIIKEGVKTKSPTVTTNITFQGNTVVITTENKKLGISQKMEKEKRKHFYELFSSKKEDGFGVIIRTIAGNYADKQILEEFESIYQKFIHVNDNYQHRTCYSCLYRAPFPYISAVREKLSKNIEKIITDDSAIYTELLAEFDGETGLTKEQIVYYEDSLLSLSALYGLKAKLMEALQERVWLKSGAYLVIQPTEALTVIDVNSGKCAKGTRKDYYLKINLEAAGEIARQLRLRNISGICIVDFINMDTREAKEILVHTFKNALAEDTIPTDFVDFTKLGLVEITRKKVKKPLWEQLSICPCPK